MVVLGAVCKPPNFASALWPCILWRVLKRHAEILELMKHPCRMHEFITSPQGDGGDDVQRLQELLFMAFESLKCAMNVVKEVHMRRGKYVKVLKGLLSNPPCNGIDIEAHMLSASLAEPWRELKAAIESEQEVRPPQCGGKRRGGRSHGREVLPGGETHRQ